MSASFGQLGGDSPTGDNQPHRFNSFDEPDPIVDSASQGSPIFTSESIPDSSSPIPIYGSAGGFGSDPLEFSPEGYGSTLESDYATDNGPILPPPAEMHPEEGYALREWRRQNAIRLEEKEKREKELLGQIIDEADDYKIEFYKKREVACLANKSINREKEKLFLSSYQKFHAEADKSYWKAIAELIPNEVPTIEKRGKKEQDKKPSVSVIQGPKPGKPTDLSRMRHVILKLKHNTPMHLKHSPPVDAATKEVKSESPAVAPKAGDITVAA